MPVRSLLKRLMTRKQLLAFICTCCLVIVSGLSLERASFAQSAKEAPLPHQVWTVGTSPDYRPFEYRLPTEPGEPEGDLIGFDIDLVTYIAEQANVDFVLEEMPFEDLLPAVSQGELDFAVAGITPTSDRRIRLDFSIPYFESRQVLLSRSTKPVRTLRDLPGRLVAVQSGTVQEVRLLEEADAGLDVDILSLESISEVVDAVKNNDADVALMEELVARPYLENNQILIMDVLGELEPVRSAIAFPNGSQLRDPINTILSEYRASGELQLLAERWFALQP